eukprot:758784-Hanusia_phi.AAC.2
MKGSRPVGKKIGRRILPRPSRSTEEESDSSDDAATFDTPRAPTIAECMNDEVVKLQRHDVANAAKVCMDSLQEIGNDLELEERFRESVQMWKSSVPSATDCAVAVMVTGDCYVSCAALKLPDGNSYSTPRSIEYRVRKTGWDSIQIFPPYAGWYLRELVPVLGSDEITSPAQGSGPQGCRLAVDPRPRTDREDSDGTGSCLPLLLPPANNCISPTSQSSPSLPTLSTNLLLPESTRPVPPPPAKSLWLIKVAGAVLHEGESRPFLGLQSDLLHVARSQGDGGRGGRRAEGWS